VRWWGFGAFALAALAVVGFNAFWTMGARLQLKQGRPPPSRVPFVAGVLGAMGALVCPSAYGWWMIPCTLLLDPGTMALFVALLASEQRKQ
jgi:hypothetical protein